MDRMSINNLCGQINNTKQIICIRVIYGNVYIWGSRNNSVLGTTFTKALKCFSDNAIDTNVHFVWSLFDRYINKKKKVI